MSIAPYWWPNPNTPNGLPYIRRDGEVNPERDQTSDRKRLDNCPGGPKRCRSATSSQDKRNTPHKQQNYWVSGFRIRHEDDSYLRYAQAIPGRNNGRGAGIIETHNLAELIDAVGMLHESKSWEQRNQRALQDWFMPISLGSWKVRKDAPRPRRKTITVAGTTCKSRRMLCSPAKRACQESFNGVPDEAYHETNRT